MAWCFGFKRGGSLRLPSVGHLSSRRRVLCYIGPPTLDWAGASLLSLHSRSLVVAQQASCTYASAVLILDADRLTKEIALHQRRIFYYFLRCAMTRDTCHVLSLLLLSLGLLWLCHPLAIITVANVAAIAAARHAAPPSVLLLQT